MSTLRGDGTIHSVPVWVDVEGDNVVLNTAEGRAWPTNLRRAGHATLTVVNLENPYEYLTVTGRLAQDTHDGADAHIDTMAKKYLGQDSYPFRQPSEQRIKIAIAPERVHRQSAG